MRLIILLGLSMIVIGLTMRIGCSGHKPTDLEGTWVLAYYGEPGNLTAPYSEADVTPIVSNYATAEQKIGDYQAKTNVVAGSTGVNWYFGNYEVCGSRFTVYTVFDEKKHLGDVICTEIAGPEHLMVQEHHYLDILSSAKTHEITNSTLSISSGEEMLVFK